MHIACRLPQKYQVYIDFVLISFNRNYSLLWIYNYITGRLVTLRLGSEQNV